MDEVRSTLALGARKGLGDDLAYLRPRYPASDWRSHANFGELASFWLHVHSNLRSEGSEVVRIVDAYRGQEIDRLQLQQAFVPRLKSFLQHLLRRSRFSYPISSRPFLIDCSALELRAGPVRT